MRKLLILLTLLTVSISSQAQTRELADSLIDFAGKYIGKPYRRAAMGPSSFDCSGYTSFVYGHFGISLPHSAASQGREGRAVEGDLTELQKGDLVLFSGSRNGNSIGHVGIFIELDPSGESFAFIHASTSNGVIVSHSNEDYYRKRFRSVRRILPDFADDIADDEEEDIREGAVIEVDKLELGENDIRIVVFADGKWKIVDKDGVLHTPDSDSSIELSPDGRWTLKRRSSVMLPTMNQQKTTTAPATIVNEEGAEYYTVISGDTLYKIAKAQNTTIAKLCELNGISERSTLRIGQKLRVR